MSGPWSSGTTAVAGALAHLGYTGFGPYLQILVARPVAEIERTRPRRNWHAHHGVAGARVLYPVIFTATVERAIPTQIVHYSQLLAAPEPVIRSMAQFCGYASSEEQLTAATQFIGNSDASRALNG